MNDKETGQYWNENAEAWTELARAGYDIYRDQFNTPAFFDMLPEIKGLTGLDIGCGEGYNTRLLARKGTRMNAIDISGKFIEKAKQAENETQFKIDYSVASATALPFKNNYFDFATSFMCLMDVPDAEQALKEAYRVLKPNGVFQFSIIHPCFTTPHRKNLRNAMGKTYAIEVGDYFKKLNGEISEWTFGAAPSQLRSKYAPFKVPIFNRTLTEWINSIISTGFIIEQINEPYADDETIKKYPSLQDTQVVGYFLHIRVRKGSCRS
jgi:ubiquinone/menaquinone biosynthesis C-methylase UbiE